MMRKLLSEIGHFLLLFIISLAIVLPIRQFVIQPFLVRGESMLPNFSDYDYLFIERVSYYFRNPKRGEIVVFKFPRNENEYFIKRVIGLPEEEIRIRNDKITITTVQGKKVELSESYLPAGSLTEGTVDIKLGQDEFYVLGDNRNYSYDSRQWGTLPKRDIIGKVFLRVWPPTKARAFLDQELESTM